MPNPSFSVCMMAREKAEHWGYPDEPYDALLETYERGATSASISARNSSAYAV